MRDKKSKKLESVSSKISHKTFIANEVIPNFKESNINLKNLHSTKTNVKNPNHLVSKQKIIFKNYNVNKSEYKDPLDSTSTLPIIVKKQKSMFSLISNSKISNQNQRDSNINFIEEYQKITNNTNDNTTINLKPANHINLMEDFEYGVFSSNKKKLLNKKDLLYELHIKEKYPVKFHKKDKNFMKTTKPFFKLSSNKEITDNLFNLKQDQIKTLYDVIIVELKYMEDIDFNLLSHLPCLDTLKLVFCNLKSSMIKNELLKEKLTTFNTYDDKRDIKTVATYLDNQSSYSDDIHKNNNKTNENIKIKSSILNKEDDELAKNNYSKTVKSNKAEDLNEIDILGEENNKNENIQKKEELIHTMKYKENNAEIDLGNRSTINSIKILNNDYFNRLKHLSLEYCGLENNILVDICEITSLIDLNLTGNNFDLKLNHELFLNLKDLEVLNFSKNNFKSNYVNSNIVPDEKLINKLDDFFVFNKEKINIDTTLKSNELNNIEPSINAINNSMLNDDRDELKKTNTFNDSKYNFRYLKNLLKTDVRPFLNSLSRLSKLKSLNLSINKFHFFDLDPFILEKNDDNNLYKKYDGFKSLVKLDLSSNEIIEEVGILLVLNIESLQDLDISNNPICNIKDAIYNVDYEIIKNSDIKLNIGLNSTSFPYNFKKFDILNPNKIHNMVKTRLKKLVEQRNKILEEMEIKQTIDINENNETENQDEKGSGSLLFLTNTKDERSLSKKIKKEVTEEVNRKKKELLDNIKMKEENKFVESYYKDKKLKQIEKSQNIVKLIADEYPSPYDDCLQIANECYGKIKYYEKIFDIQKAYKDLRELLKEPRSEI